MRNLLFTAISLSLLFAACSNVDDNGKEKPSGKNGGTLRINETNYLKSLYPPLAKDIVSWHVISQVFEGLVKFDPNNLAVLPCIAENWETDTSGTVYTFHLRSDAFFHDDGCFPDGKGRKVVASDFVYSFKLFSTKSEDNIRFGGAVAKIKGAANHYNDGSNIDGLKAVNDSTLQIVLEEPCAVFLNLLADGSAVVLPKEAVKKYGNKNFIGSGPFRLSGYPEGIDAIYLCRNNNYYQKDKEGISIPYLDSVKISFVSSTKKELGLLENGTLDIVTGLTEDYVTSFLAGNIKAFESNPPIFIIDGSDDFAAYELYNIRSARVNGFFSNRMNIMDLSSVFLADPKPLPKEEIEKATDL